MASVPDSRRTLIESHPARLPEESDGKSLAHRSLIAEKGCAECPLLVSPSTRGELNCASKPVAAAAFAGRGPFTASKRENFGHCIAANRFGTDLALDALPLSARSYRGFTSTTG